MHNKRVTVTEVRLRNRTGRSSDKVGEMTTVMPVTPVASTCGGINIHEMVRSPPIRAVRVGVMGFLNVISNCIVRQI
jgi:hypothetical protein